MKQINAMHETFATLKFCLKTASEPPMTNFPDDATIRYCFPYQNTSGMTEEPHVRYIYIYGEGTATVGKKERGKRTLPLALEPIPTP